MPKEALQPIVSLRVSAPMSLQDYLTSCAEMGRNPDKPFKGLFNVRIPPQLHKQIAFAVADDGMTLNSYVLRALEEKTAAKTLKSVDTSSSPKGFLNLSLVNCPVVLVAATDRHKP